MLKLMIRTIKKFIPILVLLIALILLFSFLNIYIARIIKDIVNNLLAFNWDMLLNKLFLLFLIAIFDIVIKTIYKIIAEKFNNDYYYNLNNKSIIELTKLRLTDVNKLAKGEYLTKYINDTNAILGFWTYDFLFFVSAIIFLVFGIIYLSSVNLTLTILSLIPTIAVIIVSKNIGKRNFKKTEELKNIETEMNNIFSEIIPGFETIKINSFENSFTSKTYSIIDTCNSKEKEINKGKTLVWFLNVFQSNLSTLIVIIYGGLLVLNRNLEYGDIFSFLYLLGSLMFFLRIIPEYIMNFNQVKVSFRRILSIWDMKKQSESGEIKLNSNNDVIRFENVSFRSENSNSYILENINFTIKKGSKVAIYGESGVGKSTLLKLIIGYYENYDGNIFVNNLNIRDWNIFKLREFISFNPQLPFFFPDTIYNNIKWVTKDMNKKSIIEKISIYKFSDFVFNFKSLENTQINENNGNLSGGEKQKIAILRSLLSEKNVLIFDEGVSAVDKTSKNDIINELVANNEKTVLFVTHDINILNKFDCVINIKNKKVHFKRGEKN